MKKKKLAIIGGGVIACNLAENARKNGIETIGFSLLSGALNKNVFDKFYEINVLDLEHLLALCLAEKIDGVLPTTELTIVPANYVAEQMGINGNSLSVMENITHKNWVREKVCKAGLIRNPEYIHFSSRKNFSADMIKKYPVIVKPAGEGGKRGICVVENASQLEDAVSKAFDLDRAGVGVLIEEFLIGGREFSVEALSYYGEHQIIQVTDNISSGPPHCVELGHSQPADISNEKRSEIISAVKELLTLVGIENSATHTEIKVFNDTVYLIELNARFGGDFIAYPLTELSTGYDYLGQTIQVSFDERPAYRGDQPGIHYAGMRFVVQQTPYLQEVFDNCDAEPWLYKKQKLADGTKEIRNNDTLHTNYFIYCMDQKPDFPKK